VFPLLSLNDQGEGVMPFVMPGPDAGFTMPQKRSSVGPGGVLQFAAVDVANCLRFPLTVWSHSYTVIVEVVPPLLKSLMISRSPS
jgi:hypothetical protein